MTSYRAWIERRNVWSGGWVEDNPKPGPLRRDQTIADHREKRAAWYIAYHEAGEARDAGDPRPAYTAEEEADNAALRRLGAEISGRLT